MTSHQGQNEKSRRGRPRSPCAPNMVQFRPLFPELRDFKKRHTPPRVPPTPSSPPAHPAEARDSGQGLPTIAKAHPRGEVPPGPRDSGQGLPTIAKAHPRGEVPPGPRDSGQGLPTIANLAVGCWLVGNGF